MSQLRYILGMCDPTPMLSLTLASVLDIDCPTSDSWHDSIVVSVGGFNARS